jgi:hypothetical protein
MGVNRETTGYAYVIPKEMNTVLIKSGIFN